jgi:penicillin-insensitive murein endopeptidase
MTEVFPASPPLLIGDLSARQGGKISGHNSHRTGRDVDLLWYVTTPAGAPMRNPGFVRVESDGLARVHETGEYVRLDVERNWALVRELLNDEEAMVQWMFVSREVEALLVDYARARERDLSLIWHAQTVMLQPGDSAPHDDHIHLRLACAPHETVLGCEGGGPRWEWLPRHPELSLDDSQLAAIGDEDPFEAEPLASSALP